LIAALDMFGHLAGKRSIAFLVSDFLSDGFESELRAAGYGHDLIAARLVEAQEVKTPSCDLVRIRDSETNLERIVDFSMEDEKRSSPVAKTRELMMNCGIDLIELLAGEDCVSALASFFRSRRRLIADETGG